MIGSNRVVFLLITLILCVAELYIISIAKNMSFLQLINSIFHLVIENLSKKIVICMPYTSLLCRNKTNTN